MAIVKKCSGEKVPGFQENHNELGKILNTTPSCKLWIHCAKWSLKGGRDISNFNHQFDINDNQLPIFHRKY